MNESHIQEIVRTLNELKKKTYLEKYFEDKTDQVLLFNLSLYVTYSLYGDLFSYQ